MRTSFTLLVSIILLSCSSETNYLPSEIFNISLTRKLTGNEAEEFINKLHFQNVTDAETEIGFYEGNGRDAIIYLTYYLSKKEASENALQMTNKISVENSVFRMGEHFDFDGRQIYRTFGMGQTHFVFSNNNVLVWLSPGTTWANDFLKKYLENIK